jgi:hypothetical protein
MVRMKIKLCLLKKPQILNAYMQWYSYRRLKRVVIIQKGKLTDEECEGQAWAVGVGPAAVSDAMLEDAAGLVLLSASLVDGLQVLEKRLRKEEVDWRWE